MTGIDKEEARVASPNLRNIRSVYVETDEKDGFGGHWLDKNR